MPETEARRVCERDRQGQGLSGGMGWGLSAPGASAEPRPLARGALPGAAADAGQLSPLPAGRWLLAVTRSPAPRQVDQCAGGPSNGANDSFALKARRLGRSLRSRSFGMAQAPPWTAPSHGKPLAPIRLDGADSRPGSDPQEEP